jgi:glycosyltransferase involved in cell wall biosynthesis
MIAFAHYSQRGDISGVTSWLSRLILKLHADGVPIVVLLHHFGTDPEESEFKQELCAAGVKVESEIRAQFTTDRVHSTLDFLKRHQPLLFLPQASEAFFYAAAIAGDQGLPWVFAIHSDDPVYWAILDSAEPTRHNGTVVAVSDQIARSCMERDASCQIRLIPYGVNARCSQATMHSTPFRVVFCGRVIENQKRISLVLEAMAMACESSTSVECRILGDGPAFEESRSWIVERGLGGRIKLCGRLDAAGVAGELAEAHSILLMSDYEGLPVALLEAMALGVVPVARNIPSGIPEVVRHEVTGLLVDEQPASAAAAILRLATDNSLWQSCSENSAALVRERFGEEECHNRWLALIAELALQRPLSPPLRVPTRIRLPKPHPALAYWDQRKIHFHQRLIRKAKRILNSIVTNA